MTHTGPARPTHWDVARLGQFQDALIRRPLPVRGDTAPGERDHRAGVCVVLGRMRNSGCSANDTRGHRLAPVKDLDMNPFRRYAEGRKGRSHVSHEASRPAKVDLRLSWNASLVEHRSRQVTRSVEILTQPVERAGSAVTNVAPAVREREHQAANLGGKGMMLPIPSCVQP